MRTPLLTLSALLTLFFAGTFALSWFRPILVEQAAREIIRIEVERRVSEKVETLSNSKIADLANKALQKNDIELQRTQEMIRTELPSKVANAVADMLNADCECRQRLAKYAERTAQERLTSLNQVHERLSNLIETAYASVSRNLMREFRIFTASNAVVFALLGVVTAFRRKATLQLMLPASVLISAVMITGGAYLFSQNWLHTIVFGQYVGLAYSLYLIGVALLLSDIVFNRAKVTTNIINAMFGGIGLVIKAVPC
jgi:hypothetical protein